MPILVLQGGRRSGYRRAFDRSADRDTAKPISCLLHVRTRGVLENIISRQYRHGESLNGYDETILCLKVPADS
jgi:hypothetical protein